MMQSVNNQISIKKDSIAVDGRNSSLKQNGSDFMSILSALYSASQVGENSSLRAVYNSIQQIRDKNEGYAGGVDVSRYSSVTRYSDKAGKREQKSEYVLKTTDPACRQRAEAPQAVRNEAENTSAGIQTTPSENKTQERLSNSRADYEKIPSEEDSYSSSAEKNVLNNKEYELNADEGCADESITADYPGLREKTDALAMAASADSRDMVQLCENEKLLLKTSSVFSESAFAQDGAEDIFSSSDLLLSSCPEGETLLEGNESLTPSLYKKIISGEDLKMEQASRQMAMVSDDSLEVDLSRIVSELEANSEGKITDEPVAAAEDLAKLAESSGVTSISVQSSETEIDLESQLASMEELQNIDDSLKLSKIIKTQTDQNMGDDTGHSGSDSETLQYGQALKALREATGQRAESTGVNESAKGILNASVSEKIQTSEPVNANGSRMFEANSLSFGQSVTKELNSSFTGGKEASLNDLLSLSSDLRKNAEELTKKVMEMAARNLRQMELNLNPENLGKMKILIDLSGSNEITKITVAASEPGTRDLIAQTLGKLREQLELNGSEVETDLAEYQEQSGEDEYARQDDRSAQDDGHDESVFAAKADDLSEDDHVDETQINSQNDERVSYFA